MNGHAWKTARESAGKTLRDADYHVRAELPERYGITPSRLSRFENNDPKARIDPHALALLANLYGKKLSEVDEDAAAELLALQGVQLSVYLTPDTTMRSNSPRGISQEHGAAA